MSKKARHITISEREQRANNARGIMPGHAMTMKRTRAMIDRIAAREKRVKSCAMLDVIEGAHRCEAITDLE